MMIDDDRHYWHNHILFFHRVDCKIELMLNEWVLGVFVLTIKILQIL